MFCKRVNVERFFISYDNMNFYEKVQEHRVHSKNHQVAYTAGYLCFMKDQGSFSCYTVDYKVMNKLKPKNFLLILAEFQHQTEAIRNTLSQVLS